MEAKIYRFNKSAQNFTFERAIPDARPDLEELEKMRHLGDAEPGDVFLFVSDSGAGMYTVSEPKAVRYEI